MKLITFLIFSIGIITTTNAQKDAKKPISIQEQGVFAVGGTVIEAEGTYNPNNPKTEGQTLHVDHATVQYQIPSNAKKLPLIF